MLVVVIWGAKESWDHEVDMWCESMCVAGGGCLVTVVGVAGLIALIESIDPSFDWLVDV